VVKDSSPGSAQASFASQVQPGVNEHQRSGDERTMHDIANAGRVAILFLPTSLRRPCSLRLDEHPAGFGSKGSSPLDCCPLPRVALRLARQVIADPGLLSFTTSWLERPLRVFNSRCELRTRKNGPVTAYKIIQLRKQFTHAVFIR
jgi:hypothetical protein